MADVNPLPFSGPPTAGPGGEGGGGDADRGQLLLITALSLAVVLVALSLILNSAIFAENLAARESDVTGASVASQSAIEAQDGVGGVVKFVNRNGTTDSYGTRKARVTDGVAAWNKQEAQYLAFDGAYFDVSTTPSEMREGVRVADDNASTAYLPKGGSPTTWRVVENARVRNVRLTVNRSTGHLEGLSQAEAKNLVSTLGGDGFVLRVHNGSVDWRVAVYSTNGGANTTVTSYEPSEGVYRTCTTTGGSVTVDLTSSRLDGRYCRALSVVTFDGQRNVGFVNGNDSAGTYALTLDRPPKSFTRSINRANHGDQCTSTFYAAGAGNPYTSDAVYSVPISTTYEGPEVTHETSLRVAPEEEGPSAAGPTIDQFAVTPPSPGGTTFTVSWSASDPTADLGTVTLRLVDQSTGDTNTTATSVSNQGTVSASGQSISAGDGGIYDLELEVIDAAGHRRTVTLTEDDDGAPGCPI